MGETFTAADAYLFVMLQWCPALGVDLSLFPNLAEYDQRIMQRPAVQAALSAEGLLDHQRYRTARSSEGAACVTWPGRMSEPHARW